VALLWVLNLSDGEHTLAAIAERSGLGLAAVEEAVDRLLAAELLRPAE
jgi:aminopeptidase-like protein